MNQLDEMGDLIEKLNYYTKLYDEGKSPISDKEWDDMYFRLEQLEKETGIVLANSPTVKIDYQVVNKLNKVTHNHPMLSLDKTKSIDDVLVFLNKKDGIAMAKMDGLTCSIRYEDGKLVSAETRGNGTVGEDITHNIPFVKGVPTEIPVKEKFVVDGEVICTYEDFEDFSADYKNPRNFASGSIRLLDSRASAQRRLTFVAWDCITGLEDCEKLSQKLDRLEDLGFIIVPYVSGQWASVENEIDTVKSLATGYPIDGIVFKYNDCAYYQSLGATGHHFRGGLAFKFYDEEYETTLCDIEWTMGKTGQLTPVAIFEPVDDGESVIQRASLHNLNIMKQILGAFPYKGEKIWVAKQNMIIPQVQRAEQRNSFEDELLYLPEICPICGAATEIRDDFLYCSNPHCDGKLVNKLVHFVSKKGLDIKGLSETTLQKLVDWGWVNNYQDIFNLKDHADEWMEQPGFGEKSVNNLLVAIEQARHCELWQFISALSIPLIGTTYAKEMAKHEFDWHNIREDVARGYDFTHWEGFGYEMNDSLHRFDYTEADELVNILDITNSLWADPNALVIQKSSFVKNKNFVITGRLLLIQNREKLINIVEEKGGKVQSSVSSRTTYLVCNDSNSTSTKFKKAKELNIPIISEEELLKMCDYII